MGDFFEYLQRLDAGTQDALYGNRFACLAVLRSLPSVARHVAMRLLFTEGGVDPALVREWGGGAAADAALKRMSKLRVLLTRRPKPQQPQQQQQLAEPAVTSLWLLHPSFRAQLRATVEGRPLPTRDRPDALAPAVPETVDLAEEAEQLWEGMLMVLVRAGRGRTPVPAAASDAGKGGRKRRRAGRAREEEVEDPPARVASLLVGAGLLAGGEDVLGGAADGGDEDGRGFARHGDTPVRLETLRVTPSGFAYLFLSVPAQVWLFALSFVEQAGRAVRGAAPAHAAVVLLFKLGFQEVGRGYPVDALDEGMRPLVADLARFGLCHLHVAPGPGPEARAWYYPTHLARYLGSGLEAAADDAKRGVGARGAGAGGRASDHSFAAYRRGVTGRGARRGATGSGPGATGVSAEERDGYIIVESNYRIYAYTSSPLRTAVLGSFAKVMYRLPNLLVLSLTRDVCIRAFRRGLTAEQIVTYLHEHAHPKVARRQPTVPETIVDQIFLWESERNRIHAVPGLVVVYSGFDKEDDWAAAKRHAEAQPAGVAWAGARPLYAGGGWALAVPEASHAAMRQFFTDNRMAN